MDENKESKQIHHSKPSPSLKAKDSPRDKRDSKVTWDLKQLEEIEKWQKENPVTKKIDEPKTPYAIYEVILFYYNNLNKGW